MPQRAHLAIRSVLRTAPSTVVRFVDALTIDVYLLKEDAAGPVLFVNPAHRELVDSLRDAE